MEGNYGCAVLAGGRGTRMGNVNKGELAYKGMSFGERIGRELSALNRPCFLSLSRENDPVPRGWQAVPDLVRDKRGDFIGPMGGILSCLLAGGLDGIFFVSCDMPLFRGELAKQVFSYLKEHEGEAIDAVCWETRDGRLHPCCAWYGKSCLPVLERLAGEGNYRLMDFLSRINVRRIRTKTAHVPDSWLTNVNSPQVYERLLNQNRPVLAVSGRKDTGKTALLERLVEELSRRGIRTAVIKHDGHDFQPDVPGTDSFRMKQAGAYGTAVYSDHRFLLVKDTPFSEAGDFFGYFPEADMILLEGQKNSSYPKVETLRECISKDPVCDPKTVLAYVGDGERGRFLLTDADIPFYTFSDMDRLLELVVTVIDRDLLPA